MLEFWSCEKLFVPQPLIPSCACSLTPGPSMLSHDPMHPPCHTPSCAPVSHAPSHAHPLMPWPLTPPCGHTLTPGLLTLSHVPSYPPSCALTLFPSLHALLYQLPHTLASCTHSLAPQPLMPALSTWPPSRIITLCRPQYNYLY